MSAPIDLAALRAAAESATVQALTDGCSAWPMIHLPPGAVLLLLNRLEAAEAAVARVEALAVRSSDGLTCCPTCTEVNVLLTDDVHAALRGDL